MRVRVVVFQQLFAFWRKQAYAPDDRAKGGLSQVLTLPNTFLAIYSVEHRLPAKILAKHQLRKMGKTKTFAIMQNRYF